MSLPAPVLDDRKFQQIVDEVRKRIPLYCPEWTDHNVSDPGITMIELFAWMVETLLYRLNRVPELHYVKFMEFLGYHRHSPAAAQTWVAFWLSRPLTTALDPDNRGQIIPANIEVSTTQTEVTQPVIFTVGEDFTIYAPLLKALVIERWENNQLRQQALRTTDFINLTSGLTGINMFSPEPHDNEALYFGFDSANYSYDLSYHILSLTLGIENRSGVGVNPSHPPYVWEAYTDTNEWQELKKWEEQRARIRSADLIAELEKDTTRALNAAGEVVVLLPKLGRCALAGQSTQMHWLRVRLITPTQEQIDKGMQRYKDTPYLRQVLQLAAVGATIPVMNARIAVKELLGESDGSPGQRFYLSGTPVLLPMLSGERLRVKTDELADRDDELWRYVPDFAASDERSQHFTLDSLSGELRFGPAVRQPNGEIKQYGKAPPRNARLIFERYRHGGGAGGNVLRKAINVLKTSIPYVDRIENRLPATGGIDGESVEAAQLQVQRLIRTRKLAITPDDYEARVQEQFGGRIGRVKCLPVTTEQKEGVRILLIPTLNLFHSMLTNNSPTTYLTNADLHVPEALRVEVDAYLNRIRMLTVQVRVESCRYRRVRVVATLRLKTGARRDAAEQAALQRLHTLLHPLIGGVQGRGWPFEGALRAEDVKGWLIGLSAVESVVTVELQEVEDVGPRRVADNEQRIKNRLTELKLQPGEMVVSGHHRVDWAG